MRSVIFLFDIPPGFVNNLCAIQAFCPLLGFSARDIRNTECDAAWPVVLIADAEVLDVEVTAEPKISVSGDSSFLRRLIMEYHSALQLWFILKMHDAVCQMDACRTRIHQDTLQPQCRPIHDAQQAECTGLQIRADLLLLPIVELLLQVIRLPHHEHQEQRYRHRAQKREEAHKGTRITPG